MDSEWSTAMSNSFGSYVDDTSKVYDLSKAPTTLNQYRSPTVYNHMLSDGYARVFSTSWYCTEYAIL